MLFIAFVVISAWLVMTSINIMQAKNEKGRRNK